MSFRAPSGPAHRCPRSWRLISVRSEIRESPAGCQRFQTSFCRLVFLRRIHVSKNAGQKAGTGDFRPRNHAANHGREKTAHLVFSTGQPRPDHWKDTASVNGAERLVPVLARLGNGHVSLAGQGTRRQIAQEGRRDRRQIATEEQIELRPCPGQSSINARKRPSAGERIAQQRQTIRPAAGSA